MTRRTDRSPLPPIDFRALAEALLARAHELVPQWLPGGAQRDKEWVCGSLAGGKGESFSVNLVTGKWAEFSGDDKGGDLIALYAAIHDLDMGKAAVQVARELSLESVAGVQPGHGAAPPPARPPAPPKAPPPPREPEGWRTLMPVPEHAPQPTFRHYHRDPADVTHTATYRVGGHVMGYVVRFRTSTGGKDPLPYTWCVSAKDGSAKWHWRQWDEPRPLYYPGGEHPAGRTVIVVEGEVKAEVLQQLLEQTAPGVYCVASWPGGSKSWHKALWSWLAGSTVLLWPDCDAKRKKPTRAEEKECADDAAVAALRASKPLLPAEEQPGMQAMHGIGMLLRETHGCDVSMLQIPAPGEVVDGWDCRDAIEVDGWDGARVLEFFGRAVRFLAPTGEAEPAPAECAPPPAATDSAREPDPVEKAGGKPWWLRPYWDAGKSRWLVSRKLVIAALTHDEDLAGIVGINQLSNNIDALRPWPWQHAKAGPITSAVDLMLGQYLSSTYGLPSINRQALNEAIETVAHQNPFHPVRDYLAGLEHDGTSRIDKWLVHAIGERPETLPAPVFEYLCMVGRFWLLGMVYRVMEPGCKFDYCPVLEGPGGLGKSTLIETLASAAYFSDTHFDVGKGKEGQEQVQGLWLYEIAELANFGKAEIALIKAFISAKVDRYRPSYGRVVESYARQCVLAGTTNESTYLRDRTGNRRFWPIPVKQPVNVEWLAKWRDQLFAEAYLLYLEGAPYTPTREEEARLFVPMQESRLVETAVLSELLRVLTRSPAPTGIGAEVNDLTEFATMSQLTYALGVDAAKSNPGLEGQIRSWMEQQGWERVKKQVNGVRAWGYARPADWPPRDPDYVPPAPAPAGPPSPPPDEGPASYGDPDHVPF